MYRPAIFDLIEARREKQDQKWGYDRHLPDDTWFRILGEEYGEIAKALNEHEDCAQLIDELLDLAAVAVAWMEDQLSWREAPADDEPPKPMAPFDPPAGPVRLAYP